MLGLDRRTLYFPDRALLSTPASRGLDFEDASIVTRDGVRLHGWWVPGPRDFTLLWCHGNAGNISFRLELLASLVRRVGCSVLLFDYRGYGLSEGRPSEKGTYADALAAREGLSKREDVDNSKVAYYGVSLGAAVAANLALNVSPAALVFDAPIPGVLRMARAQSPLLLPLAALLLRARYNTIDAIRRVDAPLLVFHGEQDEVVPVELGREVYDAAPGPKEWHAIPGGSHNDTYTIAGAAYFETIDAFLTKHTA